MQHSKRVPDGGRRRRGLGRPAVPLAAIAGLGALSVAGAAPAMHGRSTGVAAPDTGAVAVTRAAVSKPAAPQPSAVHTTAMSSTLPSGASQASRDSSEPCADSGTIPGGDWPMYGHDPSNTRSQPQERSIGTAQASTLAPAWVFRLSSLGDAGQLNGTPLVSGGCAVITSSSGGVYSVDARTGAPVWRTAFDVPNPGLGGAIVGGAALSGAEVIVLVNETGDGASDGPYAAALDRSTGAVLWRSAKLSTGSGYYTNATPQVFDGMVFAGFSPPEGDSGGQGGFVLLDAGTGAVIARTPTITPQDQQQGFAGGGIWSTPAYDPHSGFAYVGGGNPYSKDREDPHTNAILKIDLRRSSPTFAQIVAAYKGNVDQYTDTLQALSHTPVCDASASAPDPLDDPACGQLDLDFGASPNLFRDKGGLRVGDLQKSGVYHVADAGSMQPVWNTIVGGTCQACNAASTAVNGTDVFGESTPGGVFFALNRVDGSRHWVTPIGDGVHYEAISVANGVVYTFDTAGFLDVLDAATGLPLQRRPMSADVQSPAGALTSGGIAIAYHTVYVAASGGPGNGLPADGFLIAYRPH